jgi:deoxyxylulose-5-phosphate synthase
LRGMVKDVQGDFKEEVTLYFSYLDAVIHQVTGDLDRALAIYQSPEFSLPSTGDGNYSKTRRDLSILSALNTLMIIRPSSHPSHHRLSSVLSSVEPLALSHPSKNIQAAFHFVHAIILSPASAADALVSDGVDIPNLRTKQKLQSALTAAKQSSNNQIPCLVLNFMCWKFFTGVVSEQAEKSARASQVLARKIQDALWISVADGVLAETLETQGKWAEAEATRKEAREAAARLPLGMRRTV